MADTYANYAELAAAETENVDYERRTVAVTGATWSSIAIHGGGIEPGSGEIARRVALDLMTHYEFAGIKTSGNSVLHITSTHFDEPNCVALVAPTVRTLSFHGFTGTTGYAETVVGGLDTTMAAAIAAKLRSAGFTIAATSYEMDGTDPTNIVNENSISAGVQLELSYAQRQAFMVGGDLSRANRDAGNYTDAFATYAAAVRAAYEGEARISLGTVDDSRRALISSPSADVDLRCETSTDVLATGAPHYIYLVARYADASNSYLARLAFNTDQTVTLTARKRVGGTETLLATATGTSGLVHAAGQRFGLRFEASGTTLRAKTWQVGTEEPVEWMVSTTDSDLSAAGSIGIRARLSIDNTNSLPVIATIDNFALNGNQVLTVTRSVNSVVKSHSSGAALDLAEPCYHGI